MKLNLHRGGFLAKIAEKQSGAYQPLHQSNAEWMS
jgi:hypothetical protein